MADIAEETAIPATAERINEDIRDWFTNWTEGTFADGPEDIPTPQQLANPLTVYTEGYRQGFSAAISAFQSRLEHLNQALDTSERRPAPIATRANAPHFGPTFAAAPKAARGVVRS